MLVVQFRAPLFPKELVDRVGGRGKSSLVAFPWCLDPFLNVSREVAGCCGRRKAGCDVSRETWVWWVRNVGVVSRETRPDS